MKAFSLLVHLGLLQASLGKKCYYPNGQEARNAYPCDPDAEHSTCCSGSAWGKSCLANKLCVTPGMRFARGSCTDPTFKSPACPDYCTNHRTGVWDVVNCVNTTKVDTIYCCYGMENCCEQGNGRFQLLPPPSHTWAVYNSDLTRYDVVTPLSTATSSASMSTASTSLDASETSGASEASSTTSGTSASTSGSEQPEETDGSSQGQSGTDSSSHSHEPTGLSTAARAGIGVGAALGAILIITMAYLAWQLNKTKKALAADSQWQVVTTYPPAAPSSAYYSQDPAHKHEVQGDLANQELQGQHYFVDGDASRAELSATPSVNCPESPILHHPVGRRRQ